MILLGNSKNYNYRKWFWREDSLSLKKFAPTILLPGLWQFPLQITKSTHYKKISLLWPPNVVTKIEKDVTKKNSDEIFCYHLIVTDSTSQMGLCDDLNQVVIDS